MKKIPYIIIGLLLGLGMTAYAATTVSIGKNGTSEYLLYPTDTLSAYTFIATSTTASSSFANGINLTGGCFSIGSVCLPTASSLASYLSLSSWYSTTTDGLDEGLTNLYFTNPRVQTFLDTISKGYFFSTTSADAWDSTKSRWSTTSNTYWLTQQTTDGLAQGSTNKYFANSLVDTWLGTKSLGVFWSTTSADYWHTTKNDVAFSTTSADYWISLYQKGFFFSTTSADYWLTTKGISAASSTLYADNGTFSGLNQFAKLTFTNATGTNATTSSLAISNLSAGLVKALAGGSLVNAVAGVDYQAPGSYITLSSLSASAPIVYNSGTGAFSWTGLATTSQPTAGNLLVSNGGAGVYGVATGTVSATLPLSVTAGRSVIGGDLALTIADAVANGSTKGAASFTANDFDTTSGNVSIDYTNGQAASGSVKGFLTSADWTTFNDKVATTRSISTTYPLGGGGDLSSNRTLTLAFGTTTSNTWAGTQTFGNTIATNATTTNATSTTGYFSGVLSGLQNGFTGRISPVKRLSYITATSTAWTATTSGAYLPPIIAPFAGTIQTAQCSTDAGTLNVDIYHTTTHLALFNASTTVGTITFSSNNTVTNGEKMYISAGTPASSPTVLSCTLSITESL